MCVCVVYVHIVRIFLYVHLSLLCIAFFLIVNSLFFPLFIYHNSDGSQSPLQSPLTSSFTSSFWLNILSKLLLPTYKVQLHRNKKNNSEKNNSEKINFLYRNSMNNNESNRNNTRLEQGGSYRYNMRKRLVAVRRLRIINLMIGRLYFIIVLLTIFHFKCHKFVFQFILVYFCFWSLFFSLFYCSLIRLFNLNLFPILHKTPYYTLFILHYSQHYPIPYSANNTPHTTLHLYTRYRL